MKTTDITDLTDAALDVFLSVKSGEDVCVGHLSPAERLAVANALGLPSTARLASWLHDAPSGNVIRGPRVYSADLEGAILDRQDLEVEGDY
jgi:hypothetical protein